MRMRGNALATPSDVLVLFNRLSFIELAVEPLRNHPYLLRHIAGSCQVCVDLEAVT